jgi:hypothetical protein
MHRKRIGESPIGDTNSLLMKQRAFIMLLKGEDSK